MTLFSTTLSFAGMSAYLDALPGRLHQEPQSRIYVELQAEGVGQPFLALVDCGAHYCILAREIVDQIGDRLTQPLGWRTFQTAFGRLRGELYPYTVTLRAAEGADLDVEVIVFICRDWQGPTYMGYTGVLDRIQWAIHPGANRFFFGALE